MAKTFLLHHAFPEDGCMLQRDAMESRVVGFLQEVCFISELYGEVGTSFRKRLINRYRINSADKNTENLPKVLWCHNHRTVDGKWQRFQQFQQEGVEEPSPKLNSKEAANKTTLCAVFPLTDRPLRYKSLFSQSWKLFAPASANGDGGAISPVCFAVLSVGWAAPTPCSTP
ncbi:hypothetical protein C5167_008777 [Papaver somniferum]|uniref:Uncharacterized protein n=1 Tax=Papaver somniferum TaxID=3469 RepID=A0A4Y7JWY7_PAPSO|nr:hypothetical protein C5167_008777 [Papaver somniferum]